MSSSSFPLAPRQIIALILSAFLSIHGLRRHSLSPSGALAALTLGTLTLSAPLSTFGVSLIVFYLLGSRATKVGKGRKETLEDGHREGGERGAGQVGCNALSAVVAGCVWESVFVRDSLVGEVGRRILVDVAGMGGMAEVKQEYDGRWCPLDAAPGGGWSRFCLLVALGHYACCLADTLASELGILSRSPPILITSLRRVPPGTNGGVSALGTLASLAGGLIMGLTVAFSLAAENTVCRTQAAILVPRLAVIGTLAGVCGSLIDSLLGATIQCTKYSDSSKKILTDESAPSTAKQPGVKRISGIDLLTNNQVNLLSSVVTALLTTKLAFLL